MARTRRMHTSWEQVAEHDVVDVHHKLQRERRHQHLLHAARLAHPRHLEVWVWVPLLVKRPLPEAPVEQVRSKRVVAAPKDVAHADVEQEPCREQLGQNYDR
eukprot:3853732-Rhodomonas_salina.3